MPPLSAPDTFRVHFCRVWVGNDGTSEATHVEVFVSKIWDLQKKELTSFLPHNLRWANSWDFTEEPRKLPDPSRLVKSRISAGVGRFCDLGFVIEPAYRRRYFEKIGAPPWGYKPQGQDNPQLDFAFDVLSLSHSIETTGAYVELTIDADHVEAERFYIKIKLSKWNGNAPDFTITCADTEFVNEQGPKVGARQTAVIWFQRNARKWIRTRSPLSGFEGCRRPKHES